MNSVRVRVYDPTCESIEILSAADQVKARNDFNEAMMKYNADMAIYLAEINRRTALGIPLLDDQAPVTTQPVLQPATGSEWQWVLNPQTQEWTKIRAQQPVAVPAMPTIQPVPMLKMPILPVLELTRKYCQAEGSHETAVPGSFTYTVVRTSPATEKPMYKVIKS